MSDRGQGGFKDGSLGAVNVQVILRCRSGNFTDIRIRGCAVMTSTAV